VTPGDGLSFASHDGHALTATAPSGVGAAVSHAAFRSACGAFATGITVLTTTDSHNDPVGLTVSSFCSVSLSPPSVLVCIHSTSRVIATVLAQGRFALSVLSSGQDAVAVACASSRRNRFAGVSWEWSERGLPVITGALAVLECEISDVVLSGDHHVLIARVTRADNTPGRPLIRFAGAFLNIDPGNDGRHQAPSAP
jgi:flavin reductase (DIM6/NTAB) family NADH-FMN oxidoreductase RutF